MQNERIYHSPTVFSQLVLSYRQLIATSRTLRWNSKEWRAVNNSRKPIDEKNIAKIMKWRRRRRFSGREKAEARIDGARMPLKIMDRISEIGARATIAFECVGDRSERSGRLAKLLAKALFVTVVSPYHLRRAPFFSYPFHHLLRQDRNSIGSWL